MINKKTFVTAFVTLLVLSLLVVGGLIFRNAAMLRVVSSDPHPNAVATISPFIILTFNHEIKSVKSAELNQKSSAITLQGKNVKVAVSELIAGVDYQLVIKGIQATDGRTLDEYIYKFRPTYVDYENLSDAAKQALVKKSDSGQVDDPLLKHEFPRLSESLEYSIAIEDIRDSDNKILLIIHFMDEYSTDPTKPNPQATTKPRNYVPKHWMKSAT
jgi:hypothetical protein